LGVHALRPLPLYRCTAAPLSRSGATPEVLGLLKYS
jgi:hypothetical protein